MTVTMLALRGVFIGSLGALCLTGDSLLVLGGALWSADAGADMSAGAGSRWWLSAAVIDLTMLHLCGPPSCPPLDHVG